MSLEDGERLSVDQKLVVMANQIAAFFASQPHEDAVAGVAKHINDFWEPRMRRKFFALVDAGAAGLQPLVLEAAPKVRRPKEEERAVCRAAGGRSRVRRGPLHRTSCGPPPP